MDEAKKERLCELGCENCEAARSKQLAILLNVLALKFGEEVWRICDRICPDITYCPICHVDLFCHYDKDDGVFVTPIGRVQLGHRTCEIAERARKIFSQMEKKGYSNAKFDI